jgi:hypothetical protein
MVGACTASARALSIFVRPGVPDVAETHFEEKIFFGKTCFSQIGAAGKA